MTVIAITGGRDRTPTLAELELARPHIEAADTMREGEARGTDKAVAAWVRARGLARVEPFPADWDQHGRAAGPIRNGVMLRGEKPPQLELGAEVAAGPRVGLIDKLVAFSGGRGSANCCDQTRKLGIPVVDIAPVDEPRPWNRHHGPPPEPALYIGRGSLLGNPWPLEPGEDRQAAAPRILGLYRRWLWARISPGSESDPRVVEQLDAVTDQHHLVCSCWPRACHAEVVVGAWRWRRLCERVGEDQARAMLNRFTAAQALAVLADREQRATRTGSKPP